MLPSAPRLRECLSAPARRGPDADHRRVLAVPHFLGVGCWPCSRSVGPAGRVTALRAPAGKRRCPAPCWPLKSVGW